MSTTLELVDRAVETPIPKARRRRFWLVWWLWGIFGIAFSMHGVSDGTWMAVALLLTSAFPDLDEAFLVENGVSVFEKDAFYGIHVKGVLGEDLCQIFQKYEESRFCKDLECKKRH